ncbi:non-ribosomal peptide synthetase [Paenibacillus sp. 481]|uniref:non-ribosomal peptide synthetase n=1 Tax=Paenibacillus sp. 481 TaxID=2835869 RepID=UPI001E48E25E|nr:non-ribosomal peptide synthetase [Paenibacillus sp. 481]UHA74537.1 amino acid adenylation domain-containing protein [Paenibacillus sp. 481]
MSVETVHLLPLTQPQLRIWYTEMLYPNRNICTVSGTVRMIGPIDVELLRQAIQATIQLNDAFWIKIMTVDGEPRQYVDKESEYQIEFIDFSQSGQEAAANQWLQTYIRQPIQLVDSQLYRFYVIKVSEDQYWYNIKMHHIISDGSSMVLTANQVNQHYFAAINGTPPTIEQPFSYLSFVQDEQEYAQSNRYQKDRAYWQNKFSTMPEVLEIKPYNPLTLSTAATRKSFTVEDDIYRGVKQFCEQHQLGVFTFFLSALYLYLHKTTSQHDVAIGTTYANRTTRQEKNTIGMYVSTVATRFVIDPELDCVAFMKSLSREQSSILRHQRYPYNQLIQELKEIHHNKDIQGLFGVALQYRTVSWQYIEGINLQFEYDSNGEIVNDFDIDVVEALDDQQIEINFDYRTELFEPQEISQIIDHLFTIIRQMIQYPEQKISSLSLLNEAEKNKILNVFNHVAEADQQESTIHQRFEAQVERTPEQIAVTFNNGQLTYRELNEKANQLARTLRTQGVKPDQLVGIMTERSLEMFVGIFGILKAGGAYVPIDPDYPEDRVRYMLDDSGANIVLVQRHLQERIPFSEQLIVLDDAASYHENGSNLQPVTEPQHLAYVIYTSGTTGNPKGVMIEHQQVAAIGQAWTEAYRLSEGDVRLLQWASFSFDVFTGDYIRALLNGGQLIVCPSEARIDPVQIYELMQRYQINIFESTPALIIPLMDDIDENKRDIHFLKTLIIGSDLCPPQAFNRIVARYGSQMRVINSYGVTEACIDSCYFETTTPLANRSLPIGQPLPNVRMYILNEQLDIQPIGQLGELYIGGSGTGRGYLNRPEMTADKFVKDPFVPNGRMYRTGDLAKWLPDGNIEYAGRIDHQVKIRGNRVELGEIEHQLLKNKSLQEAIVVAIDDDNEQKVLCAYFVADERLSAGKLRGELSQDLPGYMIPSYFVQLERLPLTPNGKVDRKSLPIPDGSMDTGNDYVAPRNEREAQLAQIWQEVLHISPIGIHDNFFEIGGHSLRATSLIAKISKQMNKNVLLRDIFQYPTIEQLADVLERVQQQGETAIPIVAERDTYSLSSAQKRLYLLSQLEGGELSYNMPGVITVEGPLDRQRVHDAFAKLIARHETLRTEFALENGEPIQRIRSEVEFRVEYAQVRAEEVEERIQDFVRVFHLHEAPLIRIGLLELAHDHHLLLFDMHHIVSDGISINIVIQEFSQLYGGEEVLPLRIQYKDYAAWQQAGIASEHMRQSEAYWLDMFQGELPVLEMPIDFSRPTTRSFAGDTYSFSLSQLQTEALQQLALQSGTTLYIVLLAAYTTLLHKYTGQEDIVVGTPITGRQHTDLEPIIGMFVNTLAIRHLITGEKPFGDYLHEVKEKALQAYEHQAYPLEELVEKLRLQRDASRNALFDTVFVLQNTEQTNFEIDGLSFKPYPKEHPVSKFDLTLEIVEQPNGMACRLEYCTALYTPETIQRIAGHFSQLIDAIVHDPQAAIASLNMMTLTEQVQICDTFNATAAEYSREKTIHQLFDEQVQLNPNQVAVVCNKKQLTYEELNDKANRLAQHLQAEGVQADQCIGLLVDRSLEMVIGMLAILKAGGAYVPIDPNYPIERISYMLDDSGAKILLVQHDLQASMAHVSYAGTILNLNAENEYTCHETSSNPIANQLEQQSTPASTLMSTSTVNPSHLAYVIYTSGTTGKPKGVMVEHRNVVRLVKNTNYVDLNEQTRILQTGSVVFDASTFEIWGALLNGGQLHLVSNDVILDANRLKQAIHNDHITTMWLTSPLFNQLLQQDHSLFGPLQTLIVGGDVLSVNHINRALEHHPSLTIVNGYGPTENTTFSTTYSIHSEQSDAVPIGGPIHNSTAYVVDKWMGLQPIGVWGELWVGGDGVARGYLNNPELTAEKFVASSFRPEERCYRTGDVVRWRHDGTLEYKGRIDEQVKIRGYRIELTEIEAQLTKLPAVQEATVIAQENEAGHKHLCAYVVATQTLTVSELRHYLSQELPNYMVPSYFVQLEQMPLTPNGKVDRKALPAPEGDVPIGTDYAAPRTEAEQALVSIWQDVLGVQNVGIRHNFFELGGDSIKAIQVSSRLFQAGFKLEMKNLFKYPTIEQLSVHVQAVIAIADQSEVIGEVKLTPIQHWFFAQSFSEAHHFNQAIMLYRAQRFDEGALHKVMKRLAEHHDALRIVFSDTSSTGKGNTGSAVAGADEEAGTGNAWNAWNQRVDESELYTLEVVDFSHEKDCKQAVEAKATEIQRSIHLSKGPLVKLGLFQCPDGDHLLIAIHHLVIDGVSWRILLEDLSNGYEQAVNGDEMVLPAKTDSFQAWAKQLYAYANNEGLEREFDYWKQIEEVQPIPLPRDAAAERSLTGTSETITVQWTEQETDQLLRQANRAYNTEVNDLLLAALSRALHAWADIDTVLVNLEGHGRESIIPDIDITRTVGWFTSQYPIVLESDAEQDMALTIKATKERLRQIPYKGIGYGLLKYLSDLPARNGLVFNAAPEVSFNYLGQFDQDLQQHAIQVSPFSTGQSVSEHMASSYVLDINGQVTDGRLSLTISYNSKHYVKETMERLAKLLDECLQAVIVHCVQKQKPELTPSDVSLKGLTVNQLAQLVEQTEVVGELENVYVLTPMQKGMLFHSLIDARSAAYFEQAMFDLRGQLHLDKFEMSLALLAERHQIFRTNFYGDWQGQPLQIVYRHKKIGFYVEDLRELAEQEQAEYVASFIQRDKEQGFNLAEDALMRVSILRMGEEDYCFVWSFHHILMDGWCMSLVTQEVFSGYFALVEQQQPKFAPVTPYSHYIEWLDRQADEDAARYWSDYLAGYDQQTTLSQTAVQHTGQAEQAFVLEELTCTFDPSLTEQMQQTAKQYQVTINTLMQTAWGVMLQKYCGNNDVVFGSVVSGRPSEISGVETMIGLFINTIPVRVRNETDESFATVMQRVQEEALASNRYDYYPLYEIQTLTEQKQQLIDHIIVFENYPVGEQIEQLGGGGAASFTISNVEAAEQTNYALTLIVVPGESISVSFGYDARVYDQASIARIQKQFVHVMEQIVRNPLVPFNELELITSAEKEQLLDVFNGTAASYSRDKTMHQLFEEQVARTPDRIAVVGERAGEPVQWTYRELNERANEVARVLQVRGVERGSYVGVMAERSPEMVAGIWGILKAGGCFVPIDPQYPFDRIQYMMSNSGIRLLVTETKQLDRLRTEFRDVELLDVYEVLQQGQEQGFTVDGTVNGAVNDAVDGAAAKDLSTAARSAHGAETARRAGASTEAAGWVSVGEADDPLYIIYTSGTTGTPKGVMLEHRNMVNLLEFQYRDTNIPYDQHVMQYFTSSFDMCYLELFSTLAAGGSLYIIDEEAKKDVAYLMAFIERWQIDVVLLPTALTKFLFMEDGLAERFPTCVQHIITAGEQLVIPEALASFLRHNQVHLHNHYGPSETHVATTLTIAPNEVQVGVPTIGRPIANTTIHILSDRGHVQPIGVVGELYIAGDCVGRGYVGRDDLTAEKFGVNPFRPSERCYRTGDLAKWLPDGTIEYLGRIDHQVKIRGYRIEIGEIEASLLNVAAVKETIVVARDDENGQKYLCAYFVADSRSEAAATVSGLAGSGERSGEGSGEESGEGSREVLGEVRGEGSSAGLSVNELRAALAKEVPSYMIPSYFVQLEQMPLTPNGKIDRKALPAPEGSIQTGTAYVAPRSEVEMQLAHIWQEVLGISNIGVQDNFFEIGGHSLKAVRLVTAIKQRLNRTVPLYDVFKFVTIEQLAQLISTMEQEDDHSIPIVEPRDFYPVSSAQKRLYILSQVNGGELSYNMPGVMWLEGALDQERLEQSFRQLIVRHETLRTQFDMVEGEIVQRVQNDVSFAMEMMKAQDGEEAELVRRFIRPFDLEQAPLLRVGLIELGPERFILLFDIHHIVSDGVSSNNLVQEVMHLYSGNASLSLQPLRIQYKDFAVWERQRMQSEAYKQQEQFWLQQFAGELPVLNLRLAYPRPDVRSYEGAEHIFPIESAVADQLKRLAERHGCTLYMVMLAAYTVLLSKHSNQEDIIVGTPVAGRLSAELEPLIGMFVNTVVLRNYPSNVKTFSDYVLEVKDRTLQAFQHQEYSFDELVEKLNVTRDLSRNPLFDVAFTLDNIEQKQLELESLAISPYIHDEYVAKFDLTLSISVYEDELRGSWEYCKKLFSPHVIEQFAADYVTMLNEIVQHPTILLDDLLRKEEEEVEELVFDTLDFNF